MSASTYERKIYKRMLLCGVVLAVLWPLAVWLLSGATVPYQHSYWRREVVMPRMLIGLLIEVVAVVGTISLVWVMADRIIMKCVRVERWTIVRICVLLAGIAGMIAIVAVLDTQVVVFPSGDKDYSGPASLAWTCPMAMLLIMTALAFGMTWLLVLDLRAERRLNGEWQSGDTLGREYSLDPANHQD